jgi:polar amino acid transport system permease protein
MQEGLFSVDFLRSEVMPRLLAALPVTVELAFIAAVVSLAVGAPLALCLCSRRAPLRWVAGCWVLMIRGTPLLVQIYLLYYGFGQIVPREWMHDSWASPLLRDAFWYAAVALSVNESTYVATVLRGAIGAVPYGEIEAGEAFGMSPRTVLARIVAPRAFRLAFPALVGEAILLLKATVLASTITVFDVLGTANALRFATFRVYEPLVGAAIVYVVLIAGVTWAGALVERRLNRYLLLPG